MRFQLPVNHSWLKINDTTIKLFLFSVMNNLMIKTHSKQCTRVRNYIQAYIYENNGHDGSTKDGISAISWYCGGTKVEGTEGNAAAWRGVLSEQ